MQGSRFLFFFSMGNAKVCLYTHKNDPGEVGVSGGRARKELIMEEGAIESREGMGSRGILRMQILWR